MNAATPITVHASVQLMQQKLQHISGHLHNIPGMIYEC